VRSRVVAPRAHRSAPPSRRTFRHRNLSPSSPIARFFASSTSRRRRDDDASLNRAATRSRLARRDARATMRAKLCGVLGLDCAPTRHSNAQSARVRTMTRKM
jgi:hypothetical protein